MTEKRHALVTGGAGFIGSHMTDRLIENGWKVTVLDNLSTGSEGNLSHHKGNHNFEFVLGSIEDKSLWTTLLASVTCVFHFAAMVSVPLSIEQPSKCHDTNVTAFSNLLLSLKDNPVPVLYASSAAVYGNRSEGLRKETEHPVPLSPYGASKAINEIQASMAWNVWKVPAIGFRFFNVYGPRQNPSGAYASVIPRFCHALANNKRPVVYGDGTQTRDFIHVKDLTKILFNMSAIANKNGGRVFNVATGISLSVNELLALISNKMNVMPNEERKPERAGDIKFSSADISELKKALCGAEFRHIEDGLDDTVKWYLDTSSKS